MPGKNMLPIAGRPLIYYILRSALRATHLDEVWVSTDSEQIEEYCAQLGAKVLRHDSALSGHDSPTFGVIANIVNHWRNLAKYPQAVVTMRATSPLCTQEDIDAAVSLLVSSEADSVIAVARADVHPFRMLQIDKNGYLRRFDPESPEIDFPMRRQQFDPVYIRTGAVYATKREVIERGSLWGNKTVPFILPKIRAVNINDELDFFLAEKLLVSGASPGSITK